jgi:AraC family cel operon transcriptional repressor
MHLSRVKRLLLRQFVPPNAYFHFGRAEFGFNQRVDRHDHDFHEIFWVESGEGWHYLNTQRRRLRADLLVLVRDKDCHGFSAAGNKPLRLANVAFPCAHWDRLRRRYFPDAADPMMQPASRREMFLDTASAGELRRRGQRLQSFARSRAELDIFLVDLLARQIAHTSPRRRATPLPDWLQRASIEIAEPVHLARGLPAFYRLAGRSPDHVARACRQHFGLSPTQIVNAARLDRAATQLSCGEEGILDIAHACGLPNLAHFYKLFADRFGTTPRKYRLQSRLITGLG